MKKAKYKLTDEMTIREFIPVFAEITGLPKNIFTEYIAKVPLKKRVYHISEIIELVHNMDGCDMLIEYFKKKG